MGIQFCFDSSQWCYTPHFPFVCLCVPVYNKAPVGKIYIYIPFLYIYIWGLQRPSFLLYDAFDVRKICEEEETSTPDTHTSSVHDKTWREMLGFPHYPFVFWFSLLTGTAEYLPSGFWLQKFAGCSISYGNVSRLGFFPGLFFQRTVG